MKKSPSNNTRKFRVNFSIVTALLSISVLVLSLFVYFRSLHQVSNAVSSVTLSSVPVIQSLQTNSVLPTVLQQSVKSIEQKPIEQVRKLSPHAKSDYNGTIYLSWYLPSNYFHYFNYKSLESLLLTYPHAKFEVRILAPDAANYYKVGDIISKTMFSKYTKQGYDIYCIIQDNQKKNEFYHRLPGYRYWLNQTTAFFQHKFIHDLHNQQPAPFHMMFFDMLIQAYYTGGGIITDFSWIHKQPVAINTFQFQWKMSCFADRFTCIPSIFLVLPNNKQQQQQQRMISTTIISCILKRFDEVHTMQCLEHDLVGQGGWCLQRIVSLCYSRHIPTSYKNDGEKHLLVNQERRTAAIVDSASASSGAVSSNCYHYTEPLDNRVVLSPSFSSSAASASSSSLSEARIMPRKPPDPHLLEKLRQQYFHILASPDFQCVKYEGFPSDERGDITASYIYLGPLTYINAWIPKQYHEAINTMKTNTTTSTGSKSDDFYQQLHTIFMENTQLLSDTYDHYLYQKYNFSWPSDDDNEAVNKIHRYHYCSHYQVSTVYPESFIHRAQSSCALQFVVAGFMKAGTTHLFETLSNHPLIIRAIRGVNFKETGCYDRTMMTGKTYGRMDCFPYVEPHDHVYFGDGTVYYAHRYDVAVRLKQDNPHLKVLFAVRHPVSRMASFHRFDYWAFNVNGVGNINDCIRIVWNNTDDRMMDLYRAAARLDALVQQNEANHTIIQMYTKALVKIYRGGVVSKRPNYNKIYMRCSKLFYDSLYYLAVLSWLQLFTVDNVRVINMERLNEKSMTQEEKEVGTMSLPVIHQFDIQDLVKPRPLKYFLIKDAIKYKQKLKIGNTQMTRIDRHFHVYQYNAIFEFMGIPPIKEFRSGGRHDSEPLVPPEHQLDEEGLQLADKYFAPFNRLLQRLMVDVYGPAAHRLASEVGTNLFIKGI